MPTWIRRTLGAGRKIVFEPDSKEVFEESFDWIARHKIFADGAMGLGRYERSDGLVCRRRVNIPRQSRRALGIAAARKRPLESKLCYLVAPQRNTTLPM